MLLATATPAANTAAEALGSLLAMFLVFAALVAVILYLGRLWNAEQLHKAARQEQAARAAQATAAGASPATPAAPSDALTRRQITVAIVLLAVLAYYGVWTLERPLAPLFVVVPVIYGWRRWQAHREGVRPTPQPKYQPFRDLR